MNSKNHTLSFRWFAAVLVTVIVLLLCACGKDDKSAADALSLNKSSDETAADTSDDENASSGENVASTDASDKTKPEDEYPEEDVDEAWIQVLKDNGTFYDAYYSLPKIMKEDPGDHPDNIKVPDGIIKANLDYYFPQMDDEPKTEHAEMSEIVGKWIPVTSRYQDIETDFTWARDAGVDFHLILNEDGTGSCNMYDGEQEAPWNEKTIYMSWKDCEYGLDGDNLVLSADMGLGTKMSWTFERDNSSNDFARAHEDDATQLLGRKLEGAKLYRLARSFEDGKKTDIGPDNADRSPDDHFVVMVETDDQTHNGYGYMREGIKDTALYYQSDRGIVKRINENTKDRSNGMGRTKFEMDDDGRLLRLWPGTLRADKYDEYELCEDEAAPRCHLAVGPIPNRDEFEIPEGTHEHAGVWRLDRIYSYSYFANDPLMQTEYPAGVDDNTYGKDTRKYDADVWYVLREDGTGYMRLWRKYFEVVWNDDEQYFIDISGKHKMGTVVGEVDFDGVFMRLFKDEINEMPEYPDELKGKEGTTSEDGK